MLKNTLIYYWNNSSISHELPPVSSSVEVYDVDVQHPAFPGKGLRAKHDIPSNTCIGYYAGIYRPIEVASTTPYSFEVNNDFVVDALNHGNELRYVNDPKGTPFSPNVCAEEVEMTRKNHRFFTVAYILSRDVEAGEEIFLDYGEKYDWPVKEPAYPRILIDLTEEEPVIIKKEKIDVEAESRERDFYNRYTMFARQFEKLRPYHHRINVGSQQLFFDVFEQIISECADVNNISENSKILQTLSDMHIPPGFVRCTGKCCRVLKHDRINFRKSGTNGLRVRCKQCLSQKKRKLKE